MSQKSCHISFENQHFLKIQPATEPRNCRGSFAFWIFLKYWFSKEIWQLFWDAFLGGWIHPPLPWLGLTLASLRDHRTCPKSKKIFPKISIWKDKIIRKLILNIYLAPYKKAKRLDIYFSCYRRLTSANFCDEISRNFVFVTIFYSFFAVQKSTSNIYYSKGI